MVSNLLTNAYSMSVSDGYQLVGLTLLRIFYTTLVMGNSLQGERPCKLSNGTHV